MNVDMAAAAVAVNQAKVQNSAQIAMVKKSHEMQQSLVNMLSQSVERAAALAPGQGTQVDKSA